MGESTLKSFETYAKELQEKYLIPGISVGLNKDGKSFYYKGFGHRDADNDLPVTGDTIFGIASITKSFTCVAIMQLQEQGKLSVDDPVVKHIPELKIVDAEKTAKMTIHHFMTHTSGLPPLASSVGEGGKTAVQSHEDFIQFVNEQKVQLLGEPGEQFSYSNHAYNLLGTIVARASGQSYDSYIQKNILEPCGMSNTMFDITDVLEDGNITKLYEAKVVRGQTSVYPLDGWGETPFMKASGFLRSTVNDMLRYAEIFRNKGLSGSRQILNAESVKQMTTPYIEIEPGKFYGYGLMITPDYHGHTLVEHSGSLPGVASRMCIVPEAGLTGVILTNLADIPAGTIILSALNDALGENVKASHNNYKEHTLSAEKLESLKGLYESDEGMKVIIDSYGSQLTFFMNSAYHPVRYIGNDTFQVNLRDQEETIRFVFEENGEVDRLEFHYRQLWKR